MHVWFSQYSFSSPKDITAYSPRKYDCQYCMQRCIDYLSDPLGQISLASCSPFLEEKQCFGQATFLLCPSCQGVVAVGYIGKGFSVGSLDATHLNEVDNVQRNGVVSPKAIDRTEKNNTLARVVVGDLGGSEVLRFCLIFLTPRVLFDIASLYINDL